MDNREAAWELKKLKACPYIVPTTNAEEAVDMAIEALTYDELREVRLEEVIEYCRTHDLALVSADLFYKLTGERANVDGDKGN